MSSENVLVTEEINNLSFTIILADSPGKLSRLLDRNLKKLFYTATATNLEKGTKAETFKILGHLQKILGSPSNSNSDSSNSTTSSASNSKNNDNNSVVLPILDLIQLPEKIYTSDPKLFKLYNFLLDLSFEKFNLQSYNDQILSAVFDNLYNSVGHVKMMNYKPVSRNYTNKHLYLLNLLIEQQQRAQKNNNQDLIFKINSKNASIPILFLDLILYGDQENCSGLCNYSISLFNSHFSKNINQNSAKLAVINFCEQNIQTLEESDLNFLTVLGTYCSGSDEIRRKSQNVLQKISKNSLENQKYTIEILFDVYLGDQLSNNNDPNNSNSQLFKVLSRTPLKLQRKIGILSHISSLTKICFFNTKTCLLISDALNIDKENTEVVTSNGKLKQHGITFIKRIVQLTNFTENANSKELLAQVPFLAVKIFQIISMENDDEKFNNNDNLKNVHNFYFNISPTAVPDCLSCIPTLLRTAISEEKIAAEARNLVLNQFKKIVSNIFNLTNDQKYSKNINISAAQILNDLTTEKDKNSISGKDENAKPADISKIPAMIINFAGQQLKTIKMESSPNKILSFLQILSNSNTSIKQIPNNVVLNLISILNLPAALILSEIPEIIKEKIIGKWISLIDQSEENVRQTIKFFLDNCVADKDLKKLNDFDNVEALELLPWFNSYLLEMVYDLRLVLKIWFLGVVFFQISR